MTFRIATPADAPALRALIERAYRGRAARAGWTHEADLLDGPRTTPAAIDDILADPAQRVLLRHADAALVASVVVANCGDGTAYLGMLAVDPAAQAQGLGRALIDAAEAFAAREWGATRMEMTVIHVRAELIAYYERRGYALTGETRAWPPYVVLPERPLELVVMAKAMGDPL